jgi:excisionase family DNA binding protein
VAVVRAPVVLIGQRDATWLAGVLGDLLARDYFRDHEALRDRVVEVVNELQEVGNPGHARAQLLSIKQSAAVLNCSTSTIRRRLDDGVLERVQVGSLVRVRLPLEAS